MFYYNTSVNPSPALPIFFKMEREKETSGRLRARSGDRRDQGKNGERKADANGFFSKWRGRKRPPVVYALGRSQSALRAETGAIREKMERERQTQTVFFKMEREEETSGRLRARSLTERPAGGDRRDRGKNGEGKRQARTGKIQGDFSFYAIIAAQSESEL